ncbi:DUF3800 domain-containing protein [Rhizobium sp. CIAT894]|uniref:DUF3800 domain-containing protein n=1 Tax=Rhizobium sp. CIAT894 TaxID=2020312 RepID=UPI000A1E5763|nr:DUF3800 domain-containing protein [Rhizobium sp. CIAT894]
MSFGWNRRLVRQIYLDEAGTSANDTHAVVAGPVVHADDVLIPLQTHIHSLVEEFIPKEDHNSFGVFHMTDLWNNGKYFKDKSVWTWEKKKPIIDALTDIPRHFKLPIVMQFIERSSFVEEHPELKAGDVDLAITAIAFSACEMVAESLMRSVYQDEIAQIIAEDNDHTRKLIKEAHNSFRDPRKWADNEMGTDIFPFRHIQNGVLFAAKGESPALQVADMCAFFIRGHLRGQRNSDQYYNKLKPWMCVFPKGEAEYFPSLRPSYPFGPLVMVYGE